MSDPKMKQRLDDTLLKIHTMIWGQKKTSALTMSNCELFHKVRNYVSHRPLPKKVGIIVGLLRGWELDPTQYTDADNGWYDEDKEFILFNPHYKMEDAWELFEDCWNEKNRYALEFDLRYENGVAYYSICGWLGDSFRANNPNEIPLAITKAYVYSELTKRYL